MAEEVLRRLVERGNRDRQRQTDQAQSIKATQYIGNGYVQQIGQAPTRSRYLGNAGLVPGELVAPLGHGQQDVVIHKKPVAFTDSSQPQETIVLIPGSINNNPETIYDVRDPAYWPSGWLEYYGFVKNYNYTQTITIPSSGQARIFARGMIGTGHVEGVFTPEELIELNYNIIAVYDDNGYITYNSETLNHSVTGFVAVGLITEESDYPFVGLISFNGQSVYLESPTIGVSSDYTRIEPGSYLLYVSAANSILVGAARTDFRIEFVPDIIYISEE